MARKLNEIQKIYLMPYNHCDHAWTNTRHWHIYRYLTNFSITIDLIENYKSYTHIIDNFLHALEPLKEYRKECYKKISDYIKQDRIQIINGGMALVRPSNSGDELYIRNIVLSKQVFMKEFSVNTTLFLNADTGIGHSQIPQILKQSGHFGYRVYRPSAAMNAMGLGNEFYWKGLDGSEILVSRGNYAGFPNSEYFENPDYLQQKEGFISEEIKSRLNGQLTDTLALFVGGDDVLPLCAVNDRPIPLIKFIDDWNRNEVSHLSFGNIYDYFSILKKYDLPIWNGVIDSCELAYNIPIRSDMGMFRFRFVLERKIIMFEKLSVMLFEMGEKYPSQQIDEYWVSLMRISGHGLEFLLDNDYNQMIEIARNLNYCLETSIRLSSEKIAMLCTKIGEMQQTVINVHPYIVKKNIVFHIIIPPYSSGFKIYDSQGREISFQIIETYIGDKVYFGRDINEVDVAVQITLPAFGYESIYLQFDNSRLIMPQTVPLEYIDNNILKIYSNINGIQKILLDDGQVLFSEDQTFAQLRFYRTEPTEDWLTNFDAIEIVKFVPQQAEILVSGPQINVVRVSGVIGQELVSILYTVRSDERQIGIQVEFDSLGDEGFYTLAFQCDSSADIIAGIPFGSEKRDVRNTSYSDSIESPEEPYLFYERAYIGQFFARHFASYTINGKRVALLQGNCGIYYCNNTTENLIEIILKKSLNLKVRSKTWLNKVHSSTNGKGIHKFDISFVYADSMSLLDLQKLSLLEEQPCLIAHRNSEDEGCMPSSGTILNVDGMAITAIYRNENLTIVRGFEADGCEKDACITYKQNMHVEKCDLLYNFIETVEDLTAIHLKKYEITTLKFIDL